MQVSLSFLYLNAILYATLVHLGACASVPTDATNYTAQASGYRYQCDWWDTVAKRHDPFDLYPNDFILKGGCWNQRGELVVSEINLNNCIVNVANVLACRQGGNFGLSCWMGLNYPEHRPGDYTETGIRPYCMPDRLATKNSFDTNTCVGVNADGRFYCW